MIENKSSASDDKDDTGGEFVDELATSTPPKDLRTLMASGHAVEKATLEKHLRHRAYELWEAAGRPPGDGSEFWAAAEREMADHVKASDRDL